MSSLSMRPCGDFRTSYKQDNTIFETSTIRWVTIFTIIALCFAPLVVDGYFITLLIQISYLGIAALGLNILVGYTGQISLGHGAFFGFGAFASAWLNTSLHIPVFLCIPLAGFLTMGVGMMFGAPAARIKGLYLAIATLASQFIIEDFFARAEWFSGGAAGSMADPVTLFGFAFDTDQSFYYVALFSLVFMFIWGCNLMRSRDGRAFVAVRDHYLSAEIMGVKLNKYRLLSFGISSFYAGIGGALYAHYLGYVSAEGFTIMMSIQFLAMIIIGGLGSIKGTLMGVIFLVRTP